MENAALSKSTISFGLSLAITSVINSGIVIVKERNQGVMDAMKKITSHHWITHSVFVVACFILLGVVFYWTGVGRGLRTAGNRLLGILLTGVAIGALSILGFYLIGD